MGLLGILFRQKNVVIDERTEGNGGLLGQLQQGLNQTIGGVAGIVIDATVSEQHTTSCDLTENPVEEGAKITDHVQLKPAELSIEGVITDTPLGYAVIGNIQNLIRSVSTIFGGSSRSLDAYNELIKLQQSRKPFTVLTGLKRYKNMIITELSVPRTAQTGKSLQFKATMKEIRIVKSQTTTAPATSAPALSGATRNAGQQASSPVPASSPYVAETPRSPSLLSQAASAF